MAGEHIPAEFRHWRATWDAAGWQRGAQAWRSLDLELHEGLLQLAHRTRALVVDVEWMPGKPAREATVAGTFILRVVADGDWDAPLETRRIADPELLDETIATLIARFT